MNKKYFPPLIALGSFFIFILFPIFNYQNDQWRVLHQDTTRSYKKLEPNKTFLKVHYLLNNENKYDTLVMGSSRVGSFDTSKLSEKAYNMTYSFGVVGTHLHNLKELIKPGHNYKEIWLGLNDYVVKRNHNNNKSDYLRREYTNTIMEKLSTYLYYLFKKPNLLDWKIFIGDYDLINTKHHIELTNLNSTMKRRRINRLNKDKSYIKTHIKKMKSLKPALLAYKSPYRVDDAVSEIHEFKKICDENNIKLHIFLLPSYHSTLLAYDQKKMEEFKMKLAKVVNYYDFYQLNNIALDYTKWHETSHFTINVADFIIDSIKTSTNYLVTLKNYNKHLARVKQLFKKNLELVMYNKEINVNPKNYEWVRESCNFSSSNLNLFKSNVYKTIGISNIIYDQKGMQYNSTGKDPRIFLKFDIEKDKNLLRLEIKLKKPMILQFFYTTNTNQKFTRKRLKNYKLDQGENIIYIPLSKSIRNNRIRLDLGSKKGIFSISSLELFSSNCLE